MATNLSRFGDLCRLCAVKTNIVQGINIFDGDINYSRQIYKKIETCIPIHLTETDDLPKMICDNCLYKTELFYEFRERVLRTQGLLIDLLKEISAGIHLQDIAQQIKLDSVTLDHPDLALHAHNGYDLSHVNDIDLAHFAHREGMLIMSQNVSLDNIDLSQHELSQELVGGDIGLENSRYEEMAYQEHQIIHEQYAALSDINLNDADLQQNSNILNNTHVLNEKTDIHADFNVNNNILSENIPKAIIENVWFACDLCGKSFKDKESLQEHSLEHNVKLLKCVKCFEEFKDAQSLEIHEVQRHPENVITFKNHEQDESDFDNNDLDSGEDELSFASEEKPQVKSKSKTCEICGKTYKTNYKLTEHMRKHTGEQPYKCSQCNKAFRSKIGLAQHEASHTGKYDYCCTTCGKGFQCRSYLMVHQRVHSDVKPFTCGTCNMSFKTKQALMDHTNRHLGVKPYTCSQCGRGFITNALLKAHQKTHLGTDNRKYQCNICEKRFVSKSYLQTHSLIHTGEKPYKCEVCGKGFLARVDLKVHFTVHSGEKSYVCEMCGKAFARNDALKSHRRSHTGERPYKCEFCGQTFTQFSPMAIHKRLHTGERPYECQKCGKKFVSKSTLMVHCKKSHPLLSKADVLVDVKTDVS